MLPTPPNSQLLQGQGSDGGISVLFGLRVIWLMFGSILKSISHKGLNLGFVLLENYRQNNHLHFGLSFYFILKQECPKCGLYL